MMLLGNSGIKARRSRIKTSFDVGKIYRISAYIQGYKRLESWFDTKEPKVCTSRAAMPFCGVSVNPIFCETASKD